MHYLRRQLIIGEVTFTTAPPRIFTVRIRGVSHANADGTSRQEAIKTLKKYQRLKLKPEPNNEFDRWAVAVFTNDGRQIGYLPSDARDAGTLLKGEPIEAEVLSVDNWFYQIIRNHKYKGVAVKLTKRNPDYSRQLLLLTATRPLDAKVESARKLEKSGEIEAAISAYRAVIVDIQQLTNKDPQASAHRRVPAPFNRLSLLLEKQKKYEEALKVVEEFRTVFDPVQPTKAIKNTITKRRQRLMKRLDING